MTSWELVHTEPGDYTLLAWSDLEYPEIVRTFGRYPDEEEVNAALAMWKAKNDAD